MRKKTRADRPPRDLGDPVESTLLKTQPATRMQVGAVQGEFRRLGLHRQCDRGLRLAIATALLEIPAIRSLNDLRMGEAGQLLRMLRELGDQAELRAAATSAFLATLAEALASVIRPQCSPAA
jgi:hypothetical protein